MQSPFKFLDSYQKEDKEIFFGRDIETDLMYDKVFKTNLLLVYGASGTGKTSLINCGLGNKFSETDWFPLFIRRKGNLIESLKHEIEIHADTELAEDASFADSVYSLYLDYYVPIFLIFDQFEELFILGDTEEQQAFFKEISDLLKSGVRVKVLLIMREEYIAYLSDFEKVIPTLFDYRFRVEKMSLKNIEEVITETAKAFNIQIESTEKTVEMMIRQLRDKKSGIDLTNLQVYMDRLYRDDAKAIQKSSNPNRAITFSPELIEQVGELEDVLSDFLDEQLADIERELGKKDIPLDVLFSFVSDNGTNRARSIEAIKSDLKRRKGITESEIEFCIQRFSERRILRQLDIEEEE